MPHNNPVRIAGNLEGDWMDVIPYETRNKVTYRNDSGSEREAGAAFVNEPEKYYQYVEFELTEPTKVWLGMGKNANSGDGYWHAWADQKLEKYEDEGGETPTPPVYGTEYEDVTAQYLQEPAYFPGWQGVLGAVNEGVGESWNGAFNLYQVLKDMPAGEYTLTANAFYRCGNNDFSRENMKNGAHHYAFLYINDKEVPVKGLFDEGSDPNSMAEANAAFEAGEFVNTVKYTLDKAGDLKIGIVNKGGFWDEWCCFDNFKLVGPNGEVAIENGDFSTGFNAKRAWNCVNADNGEKVPDIQKDGSGAGTFRKCGGSPYKYGQQVELPAGKYRFGMLCFHRYGSEVDAAGNYYNHKWPCDIRPEGAYGSMNRTPQDWFNANDYDEQPDYAHAYIFMSKNADCPKDLNFSEDFGDLDEATDVRTRVKDCWELNDGDLDKMPHNNPVRIAGNLEGDWADVIPYETRNKVIYRNDSGSEREAGAAFVNEPEKYYQYVEFELTETTKVWLGMGKNANSGDGYWHAWADQKLEMLSANGGVGNVVVDADENAPVEYYNLQGIRVMNPENGLYIVKQGKKVTKQIIRK